MKNITFLRLNSIFWLTVVLPTLASILYFGFIATGVYVSESRFVVRSPERQATSPLGVLLRGAGFSRSIDDSYTVQDFILSRDSLRSLDLKLGVRKAFSDTQIDMFSRFGGLDWDTSFEALHRYYQGKVSIQVDSASSISTLTVRAFTADDAFRMNHQLLDLSEALINTLNERARQDMIRFASEEVRAAEKNAKSAALALSAYRNLKGVIDPERQASIQLQQISKLQEELVATQGQLAQIETFTKENPQIPSLKKRVQMLRAEIKAASGGVTGGDRSLADKAAEYQRLALEREFADKQLASAMATLEQARNEAQRKQFYLERFVHPSKPDMAMEPKRLRGILSTFILAGISWGILTMLIAGIKEHQD